MRTRLVVAAPGIRVPLEDAPHRAITEQPMAVPDTPYYRRRMADGDLREVAGNSPEDFCSSQTLAPGNTRHSSPVAASAPEEDEASSSVTITDTASEERAIPSSKKTVSSRGANKRKG